jgi:hypothetical protein
MDNAAIATTIGTFRGEYTRARFTQECHDFVENKCSLPADGGNDRSWDDCYDFLSKNLPTEDQFQAFHLIFEYVMPESLRRADVLILSRHRVMVLEFKQKQEILKDDIAQAAGYGQSISHYHYEIEENNMEVSAHLVYTPGDPSGRHDLVDILCPANFCESIKVKLSAEVPITNAECKNWVASPFHPLKNIAEATLQLFKEGDLPNIKSIREGDIKNTLAVINNIIDDQRSQKSIMFVSGVPGSGKTLVGLKTVYDHGRPDEILNPIYLSGNDPLVNILQNTLSVNHVDKEGGSYIQPMKSFKKLAHGSTVPMNDIIVFDEAQRAWDTDSEPGQTEATLLLRIGDRIADKYGKVTILCLIGDGQAIHKNEETGMSIWTEALAGREDWNIYVPGNYEMLFDRAGHSLRVPELMLDTSIRHDFIDVSPWVESILALDQEKARSLYQEMLSKGFKCWCFRNKENLYKTVQYIQKNYPESHTGLIVSSHLKSGSEYFGSQYRGSYIKAEEAYSWYMNEGPNLTRGASEFLIQGIELEYPIVGFVGDYFMHNGQWTVDSKATDPGLKDLRTVIANVYRVLLTRSRKGMFLYFPQDQKLDETYKWFIEMLSIKL